MRIAVTMDLGAFDRVISRIQEAVKLAGKTGDSVEEIVLADVKHQFAVGGVPHWRPLAPSTIREKELKGYPRLNRQGQIPLAALQNGAFGPQNILMRTMRLWESWTNPRHPEHVSRREDGALIEGSAVPYSKFHQDGGRGGKRPPRRPITITSEAMRQAAGSIAQHAAGNAS